MGAKGCSRVSMCQIASVRRRARSIWGDLGAALLADPRFGVLVAVAVGGVGAGVGGGLDERPAQVAGALLAERAAEVAFARLVDTGAETAVAGELARGGEAADVADLGGDRVARTQLIPGTVQSSGT